jgi:hypothetical protein
MKWFYLISGLIVGSLFGYQLARLTLPPKTIYQETHYFDPPVTVQEGDTLYISFILNDRYYGFDVDYPPGESINSITLTPDSEYFRIYKTTEEP